LFFLSKYNIIVYVVFKIGKTIFYINVAYKTGVDNMSSNKTQSFMKGALVLAIASLIVKIIGAVFKIPLYELIGKEGSGLFNVAYQIYTFMFIIATAGFPIAVSKMVAESMAKNDERDAVRIFETAFVFLGFVGIIGSSILFIFAQPLADMLGNSEAALSIRAISPAVFCVALVSTFRGYFQGRQNMYPTAFSEVVEALAKLGVGYILALFFMKMAINPSLGADIDFASNIVKTSEIRTRYASAGAILGVTSGTVLALILLLAIFVFTKQRKGLGTQNITRDKSSILKELILIAIPITIGASVSSLTSLIDLGTIMNRLVINPDVFDKYDFLFKEGTDFANQAIENGWTGVELLQKKANSLYGMYTGQAQTMFNLPLTIVVALGMSVVPAISSYAAQNKINDAKKVTESVLRITSLFAMPCAIGMSVLSEQILKILFSDADAGLVLQKLSIAIIFVAIVSVTNSILQAYGKVYYPVVHMIIGGIVKVVMNYVCIPIWGIDGAPIATNVCYAIIAILNVAAIVRLVKIRLGFMDFVVKPFIAAGVMGCGAYLFDKLVSGVISSGRLSTIIVIALAGCVYLVAALVLGAIKRTDILMLPKGEKIARILEKTRMLKD